MSAFQYKGRKVELHGCTNELDDQFVYWWCLSNGIFKCGSYISEQDCIDKTKWAIDQEDRDELDRRIATTSGFA
jgi:hypothetical protein